MLSPTRALPRLEICFVFFSFLLLIPTGDHRQKKKKIGEMFLKIGMAAGADILFLEISPPKQLGNLGSKYATKLEQVFQ